MKNQRSCRHDRQVDPPPFARREQPDLAQPCGRYSCDSDVDDDHEPLEPHPDVIRIEMTNKAIRLVRTRFQKNSSGRTALHETMIQYSTA